MSTCNRLDLGTLGSQPVMPKNLLGHCSPTWAYKEGDLRYMLFSPKLLKDQSYKQNGLHKEYIAVVLFALLIHKQTVWNRKPTTGGRVSFPKMLGK